MSFRCELTARFGWAWNDGAVKDNSNLNYEKTLQDTDATTTAEAVWHSESRALTAGASETFDLSNLTRTVLGSTHTTQLVKVKAIEIVNLSTSGGVLIVGNADFDPWWEPFAAYDNTVEVPLDSALILSNRRDGWPVVAIGSNSSSSSGESVSQRNLKIAALGGAVSYSIAIIGVTEPESSSSSSSGA